MELKPVAPRVKAPAERFTGDVYMTPIFNLAMLEAGPDGGDPTTWLEPVPEEYYRKAGGH